MRKWLEYIAVAIPLFVAITFAIELGAQLLGFPGALIAASIMGPFSMYIISKI